MLRHRALAVVAIGILSAALPLAPAALADGPGGSGSVSGTVTSFVLPGGSGSASTTGDGSISITEANGSTDTVGITSNTTIDMSAGILASLLSGGASSQQVTIALSGAGSGTPVAREIQAASEGGDQGQGNGSGPKGESYVGAISAVSGSSITIGQYTLTLAPDVRVTYGDRTLAASDIPTGVNAKVSLDHSGNVVQIKLLADPNIPKGESTQGTITAASATSITIGQYTLALSPDTVVKYHDFKLSVSQIPTGVQATVKLGSSLTAAKIVLLADPNLPPSKELQGAVSAVGTATITLNGYTLSVDPNAVIAYQGTSYPLSSIQAGWDVNVHLSDAGTVVEIQIEQGPQQGSSGQGSGTSQSGN